MSENQRVVNVIRRAVDDATKEQISYKPGKVYEIISEPTFQYSGASLLFASAYDSGTTGFFVSAYVDTDDQIEDIIVPSGCYISAGDYISIATNQDGRSWVDRVIPNSMYSKIVMDANRGRFGIGDGDNLATNFGTAGQTIVSGGDGSSAYWGKPAMSHDDMSGVGPNDHHNQVHAIDGPDHSGSLEHDNLDNIGTDDHHAQVHSITGSDHTATGLTTGQFMRATGSTSFSFESVASPYVNVYEQADSPATWTKPSNLAYVIVEVHGAGGGGGGADNTASTEGASAGGGGAGGYARKLFTASELPSSCTVTIGDGGSGGSNSGGDGTSGGTSSFAGSGITTVSAEGGGGGEGDTGGTGNLISNGGSSGAASGGDLNVAGEPGSNGHRVSMSGVSAATGLAVGRGGTAVWGGGGRHPSSGGAYGGSGYGGGGAGAFNHHSGSAQTGADGRDGVVVVTEYYV